MRKAERAGTRTMRRGVAVVGLAASLIAIPAASALASPAPSPTPSPTSDGSTSGKPGLSLRIGPIGLNLALPLNLANVLTIGSGTTTSTPPPPPPPSSSSKPPTSNPPPTSTHNQPTPPTHQPSTSTSQSQPSGGGFVVPPVSSPSSRTPTSAPPTRSSSSSTQHNPGTGTIGLTQRLLDNGSVVMLAIVLAATALAVLMFARLGGIRGARRGSRQH